MRKILIFAILAAVLITPAIFAQRGSTRGTESIEVKLASPLPKESPWGRTLDKIAAEWSRITNNQVRLNVRHGGIEGNEKKMQLSLATNVIQGAVLTSFGLSAIDPGVMTLSIPFLIRTKEELEAVLNELQPDLERRFNAGNYFILAWSKSGFVNIFSKDPIYTPEDLRKIKIASNAEATEMNAVFNKMGFQVSESDWSESGNKLNAGVVSAVYQNPAAIAALQLQSIVKNMLSLNIAPIMGGIVLNQVTWKKIGDLNPRYQQQLLDATRKIANEFDNSLPKTVNDAITTMKRSGLNVNQATAAQEQMWATEVERATATLLGTTFDRDLYQRITAILARIRRR
jgi:TRAP-type C4-dicarboxylate transport system substrate-binding protein